MSRVVPLRFIEPQLASPVDQPPAGKNWIHEIKYDGYRTQVLLERGRARAGSSEFSALLFARKPRSCAAVSPIARNAAQRVLTTEATDYGTKDDARAMLDRAGLR